MYGEKMVSVSKSLQALVNRKFNMLDLYLMKLESRLTPSQKALLTSVDASVKIKPMPRNSKGDKN